MIVSPSPELINQYLDCVFGYCDGWVALRSYPEANQKGKPDMQWVSLDDDSYTSKAHHFAVKANNDHRACYLIPGTVSGKGKAKAENVQQFGSVRVDIDHGDTLAKLKHLQQHIGNPTMVVESGGITEADTPKMHCYWRLSEPVEGDDIQLVLRLREMIACKVGGDTHFKSAHQPIRIVGSVYHKTGQSKLVDIRESLQEEYHLGDLTQAVDDMPLMEGIEPPKQGTLDWQNFNSTSKPSTGEVLTTTVREGGKDRWTRFEAISSAVGYFVRCYHDGLMTWEETWEEVSSFNQTRISPPWDNLRLKKEIDRLFEKHCQKYGQPKDYRPPVASNAIPVEITSYRLADMLDDPPPAPADIIAPRIMTPGGMLLFAGAPKVGKSDFLLSMFVHFAAGEPFLDFTPRGPLRIFYLQMEIQSYYVAERVANLSASNDIKQRAAENLFITPRLKMLLDADGLQACIRHIRERFGKHLPDIIAIDPLRNVFDGGEHGNENDNKAMLFFLQERADRLRDEVNPDAGIVIVHHTKKIHKNKVEEDPFQALSGANALRGYYDTGMILFRPDEIGQERLLITELRNGPEVPPLLVEKKDGAWHSSSMLNRRIANQTLGQKHDAERNRKKDIILQLIYGEAAEGRIYTSNQFAEKFEGKHDLGSEKSIRDRISVFSTKGYIKFVRDLSALGHPKTRSKFGYLCVEGMELPDEEGDTVPTLPSHYKHPSTGACVEVENPNQWIYPEESDVE